MRERTGNGQFIHSTDYSIKGRGHQISFLIYFARIKVYNGTLFVNDCAGVQVAMPSDSKNNCLRTLLWTFGEAICAITVGVLCSAPGRAITVCVVYRAVQLPWVLCTMPCNYRVCGVRFRAIAICVVGLAVS
mgnify:CR=1 FL=1